MNFFRVFVFSITIGAAVSALACPAEQRASGPANPQRANETGGQTLLRRALASLGRSVEDRRHEMVDDIRHDVLRADPSVDDARFEVVLSVIDTVPREMFVDQSVRPFAYLPTPLPIGYSQTISDAYVVALMTNELRLPPNANVLDVGTGSGYQAAILSMLAKQVTSIEIVKPLAKLAAKRLRHLGYRNIAVHAGDGFQGWRKRAPFDGIIVAAGAATVPIPLIDQLKVGAHLVMPIGPTTPQEQLFVMTKNADGTISRCWVGSASFVPLTGKGRRSGTALQETNQGVALCHGAPLNYTKGQ